MHGFLTFLFLINGYWLALILNLPLLAWNIKKCVWLCPGPKRACAVLIHPTGSSRTRISWMPPRSSGSSMSTKRYAPRKRGKGTVRLVR